MPRAGLLLALLGAAALSLALASPVSAATTASFNPAKGRLAVTGDGFDNTIVISRDAAGNILVNGGTVAVNGGTPTVANTSVIEVSGQAGDDRIVLDEANGALPAAILDGGPGDDTLAGGSGADQLFGRAGSDTLLGNIGDDRLSGGAGNDTLIGGDGNDQLAGEAGNDRLVWNPGDDSDRIEGGDGTDTVEVNGGNGAETFAVAANGARVRFDRVTPGPFTLDIGTAEQLVLNANGGDDTFSAGTNLAALIQISVDGGPGNDTLNGGDGEDVLLGGDGDDTFVWDPGDGNDTLEGQAGYDTLRMNGANISERFDLVNAGGRLRLTRDAAAVALDLGGVERIALNTRGGADTIAVGDLSGTGVAAVELNLEGEPGGGAGDGQVDTVIVDGTAGDDAYQVVASGSGYAVTGLAAALQVDATDGALDRLVVNTLAGDDVVQVAYLPAGVVRLTADGGAGADVLIGSQGDDVLLGGDGDDVLDGGAGTDVLDGGVGNDIAVNGETLINIP